MIRPNRENHHVNLLMVPFLQNGFVLKKNTGTVSPTELLGDVLEIYLGIMQNFISKTGIKRVKND